MRRFLMSTALDATCARRLVGRSQAIEIATPDRPGIRDSADCGIEGKPVAKPCPCGRRRSHCASDLARYTRAKLSAKAGNTCEMFARFSTPEADADTYPIHSFDLTKVWPHKDYPLIDGGEFVLNRSPENYFAEVEQAAFEPGNMPPGMGASPDKVLKARLLSYPDAHRYRIGIHYAALPINKPHGPIHAYHRDGQARFDGNGGSTINHEPNSFYGPVQDDVLREPPLRLHGDASRYAPRDAAGGSDDFSQAGDLDRLMHEDQKTQLIDNLVAPLKTVPHVNQVRQLGHFFKADADYGARVAAGLGIAVDDARAAT